MSRIRLFQNRKNWIFLMAAFFVLGVGWIFLSRVPAAATTDGAPPPSPREGFSAPDFTLDLLGGGQVTLSDLRGQVVMINIWASWCPPCREEMPAIQNVYDAYKNQGLVMLGVNTTYQDSEGEAATFVDEFSLTFPVPLDRHGKVSNLYQLRGLPSTYFVDRQGVIRSVVVGGPMSESWIRAEVNKLVEETP